MLEQLLKNEKIVDVAGEGDCLFWATMMGYLDAVKTDKAQFEIRYKKLFGHSNNWQTMYNNFADFNTKDKNNYHFVSTFRKNVVNYMRTIKDELSPFVEFESINEIYHNHPNNKKKY